MNSRISAIPTSAGPQKDALPRVKLRAPRRRSSLRASGEPLIWLSGGALAACLLMIALLLILIFSQGLATYWPKPAVAITTYDGEKYLGEVDQAETFTPSEDALGILPEDRIAAAQAAIKANGGQDSRRLVRTGNFELTGSHFNWIEDFRVAEESLPEWAMVVERYSRGSASGRFYGILQGYKVAGQPLATTPEEAWQQFQKHQPEVVALREEMEERRAQDEDIAPLAAKLDEYQLTLTTASGQEVDLFAADVVRAYPPNHLSWGRKVGVYLDRWLEFVFDSPREANTEGGVFPAIFGTACLTILLSIVVVPFGVLAALYLREYAKKGPLVSAVRIAINNLAGVPSIVFGVFGLGFFCYTLGHQVDELFFSDRLPSSTYGTGGMLWAACTLALLTLPVVIVATEEALAAVPNSMREGSYACGAGKWQTIQRIVLPRAMPGIMTGLILAMARGAGEVAPLMLVGAQKSAKDLAIDGVFPFIHPDRKFLHLGFHIYDVGMQSPNSDAARPLVFTTTLLLIVLIAALNLAAIWIRARLRRKFVATHF